MPALILPSVRGCCCGTASNRRPSRLGQRGQTAHAQEPVNHCPLKTDQTDYIFGGGRVSRCCADVANASSA